ncbi:hypothetical protein CAEBREN_06252 [Caenorhabditis brenneri]|uniref:RNA-directed DNA polymerase n=1 Tax=Caenorhabditis brenneri TaxID=135651 RepID=G0NBC1_CAEBE|nr:hypothetical protein CAEBREN_06252 [Caenorhabditis brenneri]
MHAEREAPEKKEWATARHPKITACGEAKIEKREKEKVNPDREALKKKKNKRPLPPPSDRVLRSQAKQVHPRTSSPENGNRPPPLGDGLNDSENSLSDIEPDDTVRPRPPSPLIQTEEKQESLSDPEPEDLEPPNLTPRREEQLRDLLEDLVITKGISAREKQTFHQALRNDKKFRKELEASLESASYHSFSPTSSAKKEKSSSPETAARNSKKKEQQGGTMFKGRPTWKDQADQMRLLDARITKFNDGRSSDIKEWLETFSKVLYRCHIPSDEARVLIPFYLTGPALHKYNRLNEGLMKDWKSTAELLIKAHDCPADKEIALQELTTITQGKKSLTAFGQRVRILGNYVYDDLPDESKEKLMATHFLSGTSKKVKTRLRQLQVIPKTLAGMQAEAEKIERLLQIEEEEEEEDGILAAVNQLRLQPNVQPQPSNQQTGQNHFGFNPKTPQDYMSLAKLMSRFAAHQNPINKRGRGGFSGFQSTRGQFQPNQNSGNTGNFSGQGGNFPGRGQNRPGRGNFMNQPTRGQSGPDGVLGEYRGHIKHRVDMTDETKIPQGKIYRIPLEKRKEVEKQIEEMLKQRIIQRSDSPFCAPIVLVRKADQKSWRFTVDFRALNAVTTPVQSVIPNIHEILDLCAEQAFYTSLDFQQGFHQIPVEPAHCARTAFACHLGTFEYLRMPMGLKGSPGTFQRVMNDLIKDMKARVFVYIDDMIITSPDATQHLKDIHEVLTKIEIIGMKLKAEKSQFALSQLRFLGFIVSDAGILTDPEKTKAVDDYPQPRTVKEVRAFIGLASFYRRFIENFSKIAAPILELTKKDKEFIWSDECEQAFKQLKSAITKNPILVAPKLGRPFTIEVDSSGKGVGAVLLQAQDVDGKDRRVIAFASRVYTGAEKNYPAIELEALGLTYAVQQFRPYIDGAKTEIITDHAPLKALLHRKDLVGRLAKYQIILQEYDITISYRPGKQNVVCDTLSRYHPSKKMTEEKMDTKPEEQSIFALSPSPLIDLNRIKHEQESDKKILEAINQARKFKIQSEILFEKGPENQWIMRLPQDSKYGREIVKMTHSSIFESAHLGRDKTEQRVRSVAIWPGMSKDIREVVENCLTCQKNKDSVKTRIKATLGKFPEVSEPFERVHADYVGPLPETARGNIYVAVFVCSFSKFIIAEPVPDQTADTLCRIFKDRVVARFGVPKLLVTDRGTNFMSNKFEELLTSINCDHKASTAYHHEANGQVERANQTIEGMLRQIKDSTEWDNELQLLVLAYNNAVNATTGLTPHRVIHGKDARSPLKNSVPVDSDTEITPEMHATEVEKAQSKLHQKCAEKIREKTKKQQEFHDSQNGINDVAIKIGDKVLIRKGKYNKITPQFLGPFDVIAVENPNITVKVPAIGTRSQKERTRTVHKNTCKLVREEDPNSHSTPTMSDE